MNTNKERVIKYMDKIMEKVNIYKEKMEELETEMTNDCTNIDAVLDYYITTNSIEKLLEFRLTLAKQLNN